MTIEEHAEMILQAAGTSLRHYTMCKWRDAILAAVRAVYEDGAFSVTADHANWLAVELEWALRQIPPHKIMCMVDDGPRCTCDRPKRIGRAAHALAAYRKATP